MNDKTFCCTRPSALCFWFAFFLVFYGAGLILIQVVPGLVEYQATLLFLALGLACALNALRNRTLHCFITAPVFFLVAVLYAFQEGGRSEMPPELIIGILLVGVAGAFLLEYRWSQARS